MPAQFLTAEWKNLIMANYIVDSKLLLPWLPYKTELDSFNGNTYVSLVGFMFSNTKLLGYTIPFHKNFEEVNLRFYVRYNDNGTWKRGVVFIKEIVPKHAITLVANTLYKEKYCTMAMRHSLINSQNEIQLKYEWKHNGQWDKIEAVTQSNSIPMKPGSEEEFIAEHYWGYSKYNNEKTYEYPVQHPSWETYPVEKYTIECRFGELYGNEFRFLETTRPNTVFVAKGSPIAILHKKQL